ncbi:hypothetical protein CEXT_487371 [Caerostris extrusa]|uniref:Uncharacterized protein n=1 Tax=Caerostris extrusa TaxID=172846 RepID=A0AAV4X358_CAEEX|nr:hypothetical protein CEXT_487371 [Caerostris extrusa]
MSGKIDRGYTFRVNDIRCWTSGCVSSERRRAGIFLWIMTKFCFGLYLLVYGKDVFNGGVQIFIDKVTSEWALLQCPIRTYLCHLENRPAATLSVRS